jgi:hypothetical protein
MSCWHYICLVDITYVLLTLHMSCRHYICLVDITYVLSTLCLVEIMSCQHYVLSTCLVNIMSCQHNVLPTLCLVDIMSCRHYVLSTLCLVDIMSCRHYVLSTLCLVDIMLFNIIWLKFLLFYSAFVIPHFGFSANWQFVPFLCLLFRYAVLSRRTRWAWLLILCFVIKIL